MKIEGLYQRNGVYWFRKQVNGRRAAVSLHTKDFSEAVKEAIKHRDGIERAADTAILSSAVTAFLRSKKVRRGVTVESYNFGLQKLIPDRAVHSISIQWLEGKVQELELNHSPRSINLWITIWKIFFRWCVKEKLLTQSPAEGLELRDVGSRIRDNKACSKEERDLLIANAPHNDLRFILFAGFHAGLRKMEIVEARRDWFDLERRVIHVKRAEGNRLRAGEKLFRIKDSTERKIPISDDFYAFLVQYLKGLGPLDFALRPKLKHKKGHYRTDVRRMFRDYVKKQGLAWVTPHCMRHTFCTLLILNGRPIDVVASWVGDSPEIVRRHYSHLVKFDASINI